MKSFLIPPNRQVARDNNRYYCIYVVVITYCITVWYYGTRYGVLYRTSTVLLYHNIIFRSHFPTHTRTEQKGRKHFSKSQQQPRTQPLSLKNQAASNIMSSKRSIAECLVECGISDPQVFHDLET